jgi:hypothetical protein
MLSTIAGEFAYTFGALAVSLLINFILLWLAVGMNPREVMREIEEDNNGAVGLAFAGFSLIASLACGFAFSDPQTDSTLRESVYWLVGGLLLASVYFAVASYVVLYLLCRDNIQDTGRHEGVRAFLRREIKEDQNVGLMGLLLGLAFATYVPVILITIK